MSTATLLVKLADKEVDYKKQIRQYEQAFKEIGYKKSVFPLKKENTQQHLTNKV